MVTVAKKLKDSCSLGEKLLKIALGHIKNQRHYFASKGPYSQSHGFSSSHVRMAELIHTEGWAPKNWCFWIVVPEKTLQNPLDSKEIKPSILKEINLDYSLEGLMAEPEAPILWSPDAKKWLIWKDPDVGKDWRWEEKRMTEDEMVGWHHWLSGPEFE